MPVESRGCYVGAGDEVGCFVKGKVLLLHDDAVSCCTGSDGRSNSGALRSCMKSCHCVQADQPSLCDTFCLQSCSLLQ